MTIADIINNIGTEMADEHCAHGYVALQYDVLRLLLVNAACQGALAMLRPEHELRRLVEVEVTHG